MTSRYCKFGKGMQESKETPNLPFAGFFTDEDPGYDDIDGREDDEIYNEKRSIYASERGEEPQTDIGLFS